MARRKKDAQETLPLTGGGFTGPMTVTELETRLLLPKGSLTLPPAFTMKRYDPDGVIHDPSDPEYRSNPDYVPAIDPTYVMNPQQAKAALLAMFMGYPCQSYGVSGSGKTTFWEQVAARTGRELRVIQCLKGMTEKDFLGSKDFESDEKGTRSGYSLGPLPVYIGYPGAIVLIDESDNIEDSVGFIFQPLLKRENPVLRISSLGDNGNFYPAEDVRIVATSNTMAGLDETGLYTRVQQDHSQVDRWICKMQFAPPDEKKILTGKFGDRLSTETINALVTFARQYRETPELRNDPLSTRRLVETARVAATMGETDFAVRFTILAGLPPLAATAAQNLAVHLELCKPGIAG